MNWIKENKFLAGLVGGTVVAMALLYFVGSKGAARFAASKEGYDQAAGEVSQFERLALYPKADLRDSKKKAIDEYRESLGSLQEAFAKFRPEEIANTSPQAFTDQLVAAVDETRAAFEAAGTTVPAPYFCGFERYKTELARGGATGIMAYQLGMVRGLMLGLAEARISELKNVHRPPLAEEDGGSFEPAASDVARPMPLEITFSGSEKSVRQFFNMLASTETNFAVIRSLRITNSKRDLPPKAADAKFERESGAARTGASAPAADMFSGGFVLPGDEPEEEAPAEEPAPAPKADPADASRVLSQVLGDEEVMVFLRLDLMQFLPAKELP